MVGGPPPTYWFPTGCRAADNPETEASMLTTMKGWMIGGSGVAGAPPLDAQGGAR